MPGWGSGRIKGLGVGWGSPGGFWEGVLERVGGPDKVGCLGCGGGMWGVGSYLPSPFIPPLLPHSPHANGLHPRTCPTPPCWLRAPHGPQDATIFPAQPRLHCHLQLRPAAPATWAAPSSAQRPNYGRYSPLRELRGFSPLGSASSAPAPGKGLRLGSSPPVGGHWQGLSRPDMTVLSCPPTA